MAGFIGAPGMNLFEGTLAGISPTGECTFRIGSTELTEPAAEAGNHALELAPYVGRPIVVGIRPEDIGIAGAADGPQGTGRLRVRVELVESLGADIILHFGHDAGKLAVATPDSLVEVFEDKAASATSHFVARMRVRQRPVLGELIDLVVDTSRLHVFAPATGDAIAASSRG